MGTFEDTGACKGCVFLAPILHFCAIILTHLFPVSRLLTSRVSTTQPRCSSIQETTASMVENSRWNMPV
jgi:hypothetical protein